MFRVNIDHKIYEREMIAAHAEPAGLDETPETRRRGFLAELKIALQRNLTGEPSNLTWQEALQLIEIPGIRTPDDQRPNEIQ